MQYSGQPINYGFFGSVSTELTPDSDTQSIIEPPLYSANNCLDLQVTG